MAALDLGDFRITLVRAGIYRWDGGAVFGVVPRTLWSRRLAPDESNRVALAFNCYVVETGRNTVLIETGGGERLDPKMRERLSLPAHSQPLPECIAARGIDPDAIDLVINTHLHWDHCGGNSESAFPRAAYYARRGEWEHAHERLRRDSVSYIDANYDPLVESGKMRLVAGDCEIVPGIRMELAAGHNRDMMIVKAVSGGRTFCMFSDLIPTVAHLTPTWVAAFDLFPLEVIQNKVLLLREAAAGDWWCGFGHDTEVAFCRVQVAGERFEAIDMRS